MPEDEPLLLKAAEAAQLLRISKRKLWELTNMAAVPTIRIGRAVRYSRESLVVWVLQQEKNKNGHTFSAKRR